MIEAFDKYVSNYDFDDENIKLKYDHSVRVMNLMVKYSELLGFSEEDIELARLIGLLHDIGRFEQLKVYHTYVDLKSVDHAEYSVVQLFDKGEIKLFTDRKDWYPIIEFAIRYHNKKELPQCSDDRVLKFANLIRDVDKIDIMYLLGVLGDLNKKINRELEVTPEVKKCIFEHEAVANEIVQNYNDRLVVQFAFAFNIKNDVVLEEYKEYFNAYYKQLEDDGSFKDMYEEIIKYIDERIDKYERNRN